MTIPAKPPEPGRLYPMAWSLGVRDRERDVAPERPLGLMTSLDPIRALVHWLRYFRDDQSGGSSPPPMH